MEATSGNDEEALLLKFCGRNSCELEFFEDLCCLS